jgi:phosphoribosylanthranilate isomerase
MMVRVKICGITRLSDLEAAVKHGADALGFIFGFEKSPRNLSLERTKELMRRVPPFVTKVLVTRFSGIDDLKNLRDKLNPDAVQLYECSDPLFVKKMLPDICLILPINPELTDRVINCDGVDALLLDSGTRELPGGTGRIHDWNLSRSIRDGVKVPVILSGGLTPDNVVEAINRVRPYAVDASSGVELSPGIKDHEKISRFIQRAKSVRIDE